MIAFGALVTVSLPIFIAAAGGVAVMLGSSRAGRQKKSEVGQIESGRAEAKRERGVLRRLLGELRPYTLSVIGVFFVLLSATPLTLLTPVPLKIIVDSVLGTQPLPSYLKAVFPWLSGLSASLLVVFAISMLLVLTLLTNFQLLLVVWSTTKLGNRMTLNMRARLFRAMQRLSIAYHDRRGTAYSSHRVQYDAPSVDRFTTGDLLPISGAVVTLAGMVVVTAYLDWELAVIAALVTPVLLSITMVYRRRMRLEWRNVKASESAAMSVVQESLTSLRVVKAFGQEEHENERFFDRFSKSASANLRANLEGGVYNLLMGVVTAGGVAGVLLVRIQHVHAG